MKKKFGILLDVLATLTAKKDLGRFDVEGEILAYQEPAKVVERVITSMFRNMLKLLISMLRRAIRLRLLGNHRKSPNRNGKSRNLQFPWAWYC